MKQLNSRAVPEENRKDVPSNTTSSLPVREHTRRLTYPFPLDVDLSALEAQLPPLTDVKGL